MKKTTTLLVALLCAVATTFAQTEFTVDGIKYKTTGTNTVEVIANTPKYTGNVTIPDTFKKDGIDYSVTAIGNQAFFRCTDLTSVTIPDKVDTIGVNAFYGCSALTTLTLGSGVKTIGTQAFFQCTSLQSVTIPDAVETIGKWVFYECTALESVTISNKVETIGERAFFGCTELATLTLGSGVKTIKDQAFYQCTSLQSITIPDKVETIGVSAFSVCTELATLTLGSGVKAIGNYAFSGCTKLTSVTSLNTDPTSITLGDFVFNGVLIGSATLYVPAGKIDTYKDADQWKAFKTIAAITTSVATTSTSVAKVYALAGTLYVEGATLPYTVHSLTGAQVYAGTATSLPLPSGVYVVSIGKERRKVVVP